MKLRLGACNFTKNDFSRCYFSRILTANFKALTFQNTSQWLFTLIIRVSKTSFLNQEIRSNDAKIKRTIMIGNTENIILDNRNFLLPYISLHSIISYGQVCLMTLKKQYFLSVTIKNLTIRNY